jgi:hypothetical protein
LPNLQDQLTRSRAFREVKGVVHIDEQQGAGGLAGFGHGLMRSGDAVDGPHRLRMGGDTGQ